MDQEELRERWATFRSKARSEPRAKQIGDWILDLIGRSDMAPGRKLPSVRSLADACEVSRDTVVRAYEQVVATGCVEARRGAGFFVCAAPVPGAKGPDDSPRDRPAPWDWLWLLDTSVPLAMRMGGGNLNPDLSPTQEVALAARAAMRTRPGAFCDYNDVAGYLPLREQLRIELASSGISTELSQIATGAGATAVLSTIIRAMIRPGDTVLVEDPGPFIHVQLLLSQGAQIERIPRGADGPDLDALRDICGRKAPRMFLMSSLGHNPTGGSIAPRKAFELIRCGEQFGLTLVDDVSYARLCAPSPVPKVPLRALSASDHILHVDSLSRIIAPGMSVGFMVGSGEPLEQTLLYKSAQIGAGSIVPERILYRFLVSGQFRRVMRSLRRRVAERREVLINALRLHRFAVPEHADGLFLWIDASDAPITAEEVAIMLEEGFLIAPAFHFSRRKDLAGHLRLNVTTTSNEAVARLARVLAKD